MNRRLFVLLLAMMMCLLCACGAKPTPSGVISGEDDGNLDDDVIEINVPADENKVAEEENNPVEKEAEVSEEETLSVTDVSEPENGETEATKSTEAPTEAPEETTVPAPPASGTTEYEWYNSLSGDEQMAFMESFESVPAFFDWYNAAKAEYDALHPEIEIDDNVIDLGDLAGGNG